MQRRAVLDGIRLAHTAGQEVRNGPGFRRAHEDDPDRDSWIDTGEPDVNG